MLGLGHQPRWLQQQAAIRVLAHHEALVRAPRQHCAAAVIGFHECKFSHYATLAHFPIMGKRSVVGLTGVGENAPPLEPCRSGRARVGAR